MERSVSQRRGFDTEVVAAHHPSAMAEHVRYRRRVSYEDVQIEINAIRSPTFLTKPSMLFPYNPAITLLGISSNDVKIYVHTKTCTWMFITALFKLGSNPDVFQ